MSKTIFSDFDGTLTDNGHMSAVFFELLAVLQSKNLNLIIVSGRSLSWGHFLLTHFPLTHCIMEGGGTLSSVINGNIIDRVLIDDASVKRLEDVTATLKAMQGVVLSTDSFGRHTDRALEFKLMSQEKLKEVEDLFVFKNINFSYSNVHLNFWAGDLSKFKAVEMFAKENSISLEDSIYFGDALNDQSMFKSFKVSVGVSNIKPFLSQMVDKPSIILEGEENKEIAGVVNYIRKFY
jgi:HAD superfamily hydrolase (TIGR01484 family)